MEETVPKDLRLVTAKRKTKMNHSAQINLLVSNDKMVFFKILRDKF